MKAKIVLGIAACAAACVSVSAFADTWFSGSAENGELTVVDSSASWKQLQSGQTVTISDAEDLQDVSIDGTTINLENDADSILSLAPTTAEPVYNDGLVTITATAVLTPCEGEMEQVTGAHAGFAVVKENDVNYYYGYAGTTWTKLTGNATAPGDADQTTFTITIDYRTGVAKFAVGGTTLSAADGGATEFSIEVSGTAATKLENVAAFGTGSLTSIATEYEHAVCAVDQTKYGSLADALANGGNAGNIKDVTADGIGGSATVNGLPVAVCKALNIPTDSSEQGYTTDPVVAVVPVAADSDAGNITLQLDPAVTIAQGVTVKFGVTPAGSEVTTQYPSTAIKVPLAAGTYTIAPVGVAAAGN